MASVGHQFAQEIFTVAAMLLHSVLRDLAGTKIIFAGTEMLQLHSGNVAPLQLFWFISTQNISCCCNVTVTSPTYWNIIDGAATLLQCSSITLSFISQRIVIQHVRFATLLLQCYNIANGHFRATLQLRCSVSTKLHLSNVSQQY